MVVVEVRQGTLGVDGRGLRSDREHCASRVAVEAGGGGEERRRGAGN